MFAMPLPSLIILAEDLNKFVDQFQCQQDVIIYALIDLDRVSEFEQEDRPMICSMESLRLKIKTIVVSTTSASEIKSKPSSVTAPAPQQSIPLPKIDLGTYFRR